MKPSADQLARLKAYYEAKVSSEVEINAVKHKVQEGKGVFVVLDARSRDAFPLTWPQFFRLAFRTVLEPKFAIRDWEGCHEKTDPW